MPRAAQSISRCRGLGPVVVLPIAVWLLAPTTWPRWAVMWALAVAIFAGCKWLTWRRTPAAEVPWSRHAGYLLAWPGLDAAAFLRSDRSRANPQPHAMEWIFALLKMLFGGALFWGGQHLVPNGKPIVLGWVGMIGVIFLLHFGSFHLLSCAWRSCGVDARPLMNNPIASISVSEFWGKRWNTAFRDLTHRFLFRPLAGRLGPHGALAAVFAFSGLVHDVVISVPAGGGYGGPTLFFLIQAAALAAERSQFGRSVGLARGWRGRLFALAVLVGPAYALFHPPFVTRIVVPFMHALGAA